MINKINVYSPQKINFASNKKQSNKNHQKNLEASIERSLILNPSTSEIQYRIFYYKQIDELVKSYNKTKSEAQKLIQSSKQDFKTNEQDFQHYQNQAYDAIDNHILMPYNSKIFYEYPKRCLIQFRDNLTTENYTKLPVYAVVEDKNQNNTIYAFDSNVALNNNNNNNNSSDAIHVFSIDGDDDNIYSKLAKITGSILTLNNVKEKQPNVINADSLLLYEKDDENNLICKKLFINPKISIFEDSKECIIRADEAVEYLNDESIKSFYKDYKEAYSDGYKVFTFENYFSAKIDTLYTQGNENYGIFTMKDSNPFFLNRYIKLHD